MVTLHSEIKPSDWSLQVMGQVLTNQSAIIQSRVVLHLWNFLMRLPLDSETKKISKWDNVYAEMESRDKPSKCAAHEDGPGNLFTECKRIT